MYLVRGGVPGSGGVPSPGGVYMVPRGCTSSRGVYLVLGGVPGLGGPGPRGGVLCPGGCTWSGTPPREQNHTHL